MKSADQTATQILKTLLPDTLFRKLRDRRRTLQHKLLAFDRVTDFSVLRRLKPYRPGFGWNRGQCIDRYYIENFLAANSHDIRGHVLEITDNSYTKRYGGARVSQSDVLDIDTSNPSRTITDDLTHCNSIPDNTFDCIILTQTLLLIFDFQSAIRSLHRILKPGGVVLATIPGIAQLCPPIMVGGATEYWHFTRHSAGRAFGECFGQENATATTYGNVLAAVAFLHGLVTEELTNSELDFNDPDYEVTIGIRASKGNAVRQ